MAAPAEIPGDHHWRVRVGNEEKVLTLDQLDDLFRLEIIDGDTKVWQPGMPEWLPLSVVAGMDEGSGATATPAPELSAAVPAQAELPAQVMPPANVAAPVLLSAEPAAPMLLSAEPPAPALPPPDLAAPVVPAPVVPVTVAARPLLPPFTALSGQLPVERPPTPEFGANRPLPASGRAQSSTRTQGSIRSAPPSSGRAPVRAVPASLKSTLPLSTRAEIPSANPPSANPPSANPPSAAPSSVSSNDGPDSNENLGSNMNTRENLGATMTLGSNEGPASDSVRSASFAPVSSSRPPPPSARIPLAPPRPGRPSSAPPQAPSLGSTIPSFAPPPFTPPSRLSLLGAELVTPDEADSALPALSPSGPSPLSAKPSLPVAPTPLPSSPLSGTLPQNQAPAPASAARESVFPFAGESPAVPVAKNLEPIGAPRVKRGALGKGQRIALAAIGLLGLSITLHRNDVLAKLARASGGEPAYQSFHAAFGGPSPQTPQGVRAFTASLPPIASPESLKPPPAPRPQPRTQVESLVAADPPPPAPTIKSESKAKSAAKKKAKGAKAKAAAAKK